MKSAQQKIKELLELNESYSAAANNFAPADDIDMALAEFMLKEWPDGSTAPRPVFQRESYGVYYSGRKRVQLKLGKGKQLMVRIGAGLVSMKEFIANMKYDSAETS